MTGENGGERERLAPVIPLFGAAGAARSARDAEPRGTSRPVEAADAGASSGAAAARGEADDGWHRSWIDDAPASRSDGGSAVGACAAVADASAAAEAVADAEKALLRKLRGRSLSVREAQKLAREHGLDPEATESLLAAFLARGYLDDARLAEQLVYSGSERKGQGRQAIARTLAGRGIPRDVADAALASLADDDAERALEFARTKARSMRGLDRDVALRRLSGQLARRGYGGQSLDAARRALDELSHPTHGVRFE